MMNRGSLGVLLLSIVLVATPSFGLATPPCPHHSEFGQQAVTEAPVLEAPVLKEAPSCHAAPGAESLEASDAGHAGHETEESDSCCCAAGCCDAGTGSAAITAVAADEEPERVFERVVTGEIDARHLLPVGSASARAPPAPLV